MRFLRQWVFPEPKRGAQAVLPMAIVPKLKDQQVSLCCIPVSPVLPKALLGAWLPLNPRVEGYALV